MSDVVIHRCTLRIVRRDGWSWGPDPQQLLSRAVRALPELIARRLAGMWPDESSDEIFAPLRISIPITLAELTQLSPEIGGPSPQLFESQSTMLDARIARALTTALGREPEGYEDAEDKEEFGTRKKARGKTGVSIEISEGGAVLRTLMAWHAAGILNDRLRAFSIESLVSWYRALLRCSGTDSAASTMTKDEVRHKLQSLLREFAEPIRDQTDVMIRRIILTLRLATELRLDPDSEVIRDEIETVLLLDGEARDLTRVADRAPQGQESRSIEVQARRDPAPVLTHQVSGDVHVSSVLPFLLLGPLSRSGYLQALAANLEALELSALSPLFAVALAYKVLDPPARGWLRQSATSSAAAAFAAITGPVDDADLDRLERELSEHLSPLDAALSGSLIEGHDETQPLLVVRAGDGYLLVDVDGLFPIAWTSGLEEVCSTVRRFRGSIVLVPESIADPRSLRLLDDEGASFVTDAHPTRDEYWRAIRQGSDRWWTNEMSSRESPLVKIARRLENSSVEAAELWQMLAIDRPIRRSDHTSAFDRHLTLTAATALGTIAWQLWREREAPVPQLALQRFSDMDGRIVFSEDAVRVMLPLGRRRQDLSEHGLLEDVRDVPWLGGRILQFSGG